MSEEQEKFTLHDLEYEIKTKIRFGASKDTILRSLVRKYSEDLGADEVKEFIIQKVEDYKDYELIQMIMRSQIIQEANGRKNFILDPKTRSVTEITKERLSDVLHPKLDISEKTVTCIFSYNPFIFKQIYKDQSGRWTYNQYIPPFWQEDVFYSNGTVSIKKEDELPEIIHRFLMHLVAGDQRSYDYMLNWAANAVQFRNFCILTTIGTFGIGKGKFGEIMKAVVGESNYGETGQRILAERFNGQIKNRRLIYCDEVSVKSDMENERLKVLVNNVVEVEAKGKDAEQVQNFASIYFSSNSLDAIRIEANDRRFSIINLTDVPLRNVFTVEEINEMTSIAVIDKFARYLYYRPVNKQEMLDVHISKRTQEVREASMAGWHDWLVDEFAVDNAGKTFKIDEIAEAVVEKYGAKFRPSRAAFQRIERQFPNKLKVYKPVHEGRQVWVVKFPEIEKSPTKPVETSVLSNTDH